MRESLLNVVDGDHDDDDDDAIGTKIESPLKSFSETLAGNYFPLMFAILKLKQVIFKIVSGTFDYNLSACIHIYSLHLYSFLYL